MTVTVGASFIAVGALVVAATFIVAVARDRRGADRATPAIFLGSLAAVVLLTIGTWTTLTDTNNIAHWVLKILVTLIAAITAVVAIGSLRTNHISNASGEQETR